MTVPNWWEFLLLAGASWRIFQLLAHDEILDRPRRWVLNLRPEWKKTGDPVEPEYRLRLALFMVCPYCFGFWIAVAVWLCWQISAHWTDVLATPFALSAALVAGAKLLSSDESP